MSAAFLQIYKQIHIHLLYRSWGTSLEVLGWQYGIALLHRLKQFFHNLPFGFSHPLTFPQPLITCLDKLPKHLSNIYLVCTKALQQWSLPISFSFYHHDLLRITCLPIFNSIQKICILLSSTRPNYTQKINSELIVFEVHFKRFLIPTLRAIGKIASQWVLAV